ncbi:helicase-exonuclease AddAB subunit AddA [Butyrivibrio sp. INlla14]|uniref:helicase-exonuclease AddAB subunit AddA n=1 Tax=Butyrivibrio sp. INlla14 TaxID=1520808 RepID=UPI00087618BA|nr:helicase-exonuclease AddAB subunit AddA [Butyrivibrio sp. INlla14]SCY42154.1 DNA helicase/exodeoxyribonuclease V, subunit A [Butyrivibrio sp. INlla14]
MGISFTDEQQSVIDARDCNILVSAAAGSGKTAVLVERIIQMVLEGCDIDHLLVVTFTKAAASQMKEKITAAIQKKLMEEPDNKHLQKQETLIHNAQITTIDSFCQYVLRNNFNAIGVDPSFRVGDDGELRLLQEDVMQEMLEEEYARAKEEGEGSDFLFCMDYFSTGSNDKKVESYISSLYRFSMSMPWPEDWISERARDYQLDGACFDELDWVIDCIDMTRTKVKEMVENLDAAEKICCESDGPYMYGDMLDGEKASVEAVLKYDTYDQLFDGLRIARNSFGRLPSKKDDSVNPDKREYVKDLRSSVKDDLGKLVETYFALPSETILDQMKLCDRAVKELCRLTIRYKQLFDEKKRERQLIDFSDMEHFALQILVDHPAEEETKGKSCQEIIDMCTASAVALEYRDYYKEVLIDEYQDSNNVQELILKSISGETPDKSERFMVGDVKQSIYKFRLARPEIFMEKLSTYSKDAGAKDRRIDLHMNFRSRKEVLFATNYIFEKIMGTDLGSVDYDKDARLVPGAKCEEAGFDITPELIMFDSASDNDLLADYDPKEKEALVIAERIHKLMKEDSSIRFKDIVILLRSVSGWDDTFKKVLEEQGIPAYIESKSGYFDAYEVSVLLDLLAIVDNPSLDIPLVSVMHSPIGGFDDQELARLRVLADSDERACLEDSFYYGIKEIVEAGDGENRETLAGSEEVLDKAEDFIDFIEDLRTLSVYTPVHELLEYIIEKTGFDNYCLAMPCGNQRKANIDQLLARAFSFEKTSFKGLFHFVRYIEHMRFVQVDYGEAGIIDENADVVRIMSIHKSKGLEFPVVFVSGLTKSFNRMDTKGDLIADMDLGIGVKCIDPDLRVKYDTLKRLIIADKMTLDSLGEELRVLYVALTRAKDKLILTASVKNLFDKIGGVVKKLPVLAGDDRLLPYSVRAGAGSYFDLILSALVRHPSFADAAQRLGFAPQQFSEYIDKTSADTAFNFIFLNDEDIIADILTSDMLGINRQKELEDNILSFDEEIADRLKVKFESKYAFENLKGLFTKTTVTELKKHKLEEMGEAFANVATFVTEAEEVEFIEHSRDTELSEDAEVSVNSRDADRTEKDSEIAAKELSKEKEKKLTGADRGTAYHRVMEILDKEIYGDEDFMERARTDAEGGQKVTPVAKRIYAWMGQQVKKGMIPEDYLSCVYSPDIEAFLRTDLGKRMGEAYRRGDLYREKPFMMGISARDLNEKYPEDEMVLIQGIIDAWFVENGEIVLLDYKTDRVKEAGELVSRYSIQLDLYKQALERTTNMKVKEVLIYSFGLAEVIPLNVI